MRRLLLIMTASLMILILLCACSRQETEPPNAMGTETGQLDSPGDTEPTDTETHTEGDTGRQAAVDAALQAGDRALLWQIDDGAKLSGIGTTWSYRDMDCEALWAEVKTELFPGAEVLSSQEESDGAGTLIALKDGNTNFHVRVETHWISIDGLDQDAAVAVAGKLAALVTERSGFTLKEVSADLDEGETLRYAFFADGVQVDTEPIDLTMGTVLRVLDGNVTLEFPLELGEVLETTDLSATFSMSEAKLLCDLQWDANPFPWVLALDSWQPLLTVDTENESLIPSWQFSGRFWTIDGTGFSRITDFVVNALTGEVLRFG